MSDHTSGTGGVPTDQEPSMEDILASIREVIAKAPAPVPTPDVDLGDAGIAAAYAGVRPTLVPNPVTPGTETQPESVTALDDRVDLTIPQTETPDIELSAPTQSSDVVTDFDTLDLVETTSLNADLDMRDVPEVASVDLDDTILDLTAPAELPADLEVSGPAETALEDINLLSDTQSSEPVIEPVSADTLDLDMTDDLIEVFAEESALDTGDFDIPELPAETLADTPIETAVETSVPDEISALAETSETDAGFTAPETDDIGIDIDSLLGEDLLDDAPAPEHVSAPIVENVPIIEDVTSEPDSEDWDLSDLDLDTENLDDSSADLKSAADMTSRDDNDIEMVKSLMADLTDDNYDEFEDSADGEDTEMLEASMDDVVDADSAEDVISTSGDFEDFGQDDVIYEILETSVTEEAALHEADALEASEPAEDVDDLAALALEAETEAQKATQRLSDFQSRVDPDDVLVLETPIEGAAGDFETDLHSAGLAAGAAAALGAGTALASATGQDDDLAQDAIDIDPETEIYFETDEEEPDMAEAKKVATARVDRSTEAAAGGAFASLAKTVERKETEYESGPAIGDMVNEALKPMLKEWLDKNLKDIVEKAVAKEIKRISGSK